MLAPVDNSNSVSTLTFESAEKALYFLRDTARKYGSLKGHQLFTEANLRRIKSIQMLELEGSLGEREAKAYASEPYLRAMKDYEDTTAEFETLRAQRDAAAIAVEMWRSINSSKAKGIDL